MLCNTKYIISIVVFISACLCALLFISISSYKKSNVQSAMIQTAQTKENLVSTIPINSKYNTKMNQIKSIDNISISEYEQLYNKKYSQYKSTNFNLSDNFKHIFLFWHSDHLPAMVNECVKKVKSKLSSWSVILLNNQTIHKFIKKDAFPKKYNQIKFTAIKCDWIRLYLLYNYGGLWIDISTIINDPAIIEQLYANVNDSKPIGIYKLDVNSFTHNSITYTCVENWFIMVKSKHNHILKLWMDEFEHAIDMGINPYFRSRKAEFTLSNTHVSQLSYFAMFIAFQVIVQKFNITNDKFASIDAKKDMLVYHFNPKKIYEHEYKENLKIDSITRSRIYGNIEHLSKLMNMYFGVVVN
jgi:hypothetical protein